MLDDADRCLERGDPLIVKSHVGGRPAHRNADGVRTSRRVPNRSPGGPSRDSAASIRIHEPERRKPLGSQVTAGLLVGDEHEGYPESALSGGRGRVDHGCESAFHVRGPTADESVAVDSSVELILASKVARELDEARVRHPAQMPLVRPPSTTSAVPVTHSASSDARYTMPSAMSRGAPRRPRGWMLVANCRDASGSG